MGPEVHAGPDELPGLPCFRVRAATALVSFAAIGIELALMRILALRFWHHFAFMSISVALLGFGASGTLLSIFIGRLLRRLQPLLAVLITLFAFSIPAANLAVRVVPLNVQYLPWNISAEMVNVLLLELLLCVPFLFAGASIGTVLLDLPERVGGHYAWNLIGSGLGAVGTVLLMWVVPAGVLPAVMALPAFAGGLLVIPWGRSAWRWFAALSAPLLALVLLATPRGPRMSEYKLLSQLLEMTGARLLLSEEGPLGRIDVMGGDAVHYAPGLSLTCTASIPAHVLMISDGDQASPVYNTADPADWQFMDCTTQALACHLRPRSRVAVVGAGGGADIGLAGFYGARHITGLEIDPTVIHLMRGPLSKLGGDIYDAPSVEIVNQEARGFFAASPSRFELIMLPQTGAFGASGAGLYAAQESYLYTAEAVNIMLDRLAPHGILAVTGWMRTPPRDGLRMFNLLREALVRRGVDPAPRLAMIRSWITVTVLATPDPWSEEDVASMRTFCQKRKFDLCYLPGMSANEANRYHVLERPYYFELAPKLLGHDRPEVLRNYFFRLEAATDDRPYFYHFFKWNALPLLRERLRGQSPAFVETGYLMIVAALLQTAVLSAVLMLVPLIPTVHTLRSTTGKLPVFAYFTLLGIGFMFLEMGFLQQLILYLAHPVYSAAVAISGFLIFGGLGSYCSSRWRCPPGTAIAVLAAAAGAIGAAYTVGLHAWLGLTLGWPLALRFCVALLTIAPLAFAMGQLFPLGLRSVAMRTPQLVPWAWAVNGCASVIATVAVPLLAMEAGFSTVAKTAVGCYLLAGLIGKAALGQAGRRK
jgi:hypothetical protein